MKRTTIVAPEELLERLRRVAEDRGISLASLIREALEEKANTCRPKPRSLGMGDSGRTDIARRTAEEPIVPDSGFSVRATSTPFRSCPSSRTRSTRLP